MKKSLKIAVVLVCIMSLLFGQSAFADSGKEGKENGSKGWEKNQRFEKNLNNYQQIEGSKILINNKKVKFDVPPVIKEGRTLIPVRAITEGMGATVAWDAVKSIVTITSPDGLIIIKLYLAEADGGKITVTQDNVTTVVTTDVRPGIINNRTFVPLRFIAEVFGRHIGYDGDTGQIDIEDGPTISPKSVQYTTPSAIIADLPITMTLNGYTFTGIENLDAANYTFIAPNTVLIKEAYLESLKVKQTMLNFVFTKGADTEKRELNIKLPYNQVIDSPKLTPESVKFNLLADITSDVIVNLKLNGYTFEGIEGLTGDQFAYNGTTSVMIKAPFIKALTTEKTKLNFLFKKDAVIIKESFEIELVYNKVIVEVIPDVTPDKISFNLLADITADVSLILDLKGYFFDGINGLTPPQYTYDGLVTVKLDDAYLKGLASNKTILTLLFHKGTSPVISKTVPVEIELKYIAAP